MIEKYDFGVFIIDGKAIEQDIIVLNNKISLRKNKNHCISIDEVKYLLDKGIKNLVIGTGYDGAAYLDRGAMELIRNKGIRLIIGKTGEVYKRMNELEDCGAILHSTC